MSNSSPDIAELIADAVQSEFVISATISGTGKSSVKLATMVDMLMELEALVFYDYALTLSTEITEIWKSKFSGVQALYFMIRYSYMAGMVLNSAAYIVQNSSEQRSQVILVVLVSHVFGKASDGLHFLPVHPPSTTVVLPELTQFTCEHRVQLVSIIIPLVIDVLVFTLTFAKTIHHAIEMRKVGPGNGLGYLILRDGDIGLTTQNLQEFLPRYGFPVFVVVAAVYPFTAVKGATGSWVAVVGSICNPLTVILINRLVLSLRQVSHAQEGNAPTLSAIDTIQEPAFATNSFLGNLGAPLRLGPNDDKEMEEIGLNNEAEVFEGRQTVNHSDIAEEPRNPSDV
ncbi:hypothetical protein BD410DRAFT_879842 [Rickenella mellea]|uniref:DUF6533 domain-containing protein n=1 Tax=Rickenella mellea TaxID=50990 RepID=A0A4Y7PUB3_9AGAM|nr:hypothetical protein BD410DRAFT_879842 [Rickenella mellea]